MPELIAGLVSVVVPIYNVEAFLRDCLDSIRDQTYARLQVVLVDDGSTDGSAAIAEEYVAADPRFVLVRQANAGLSAARNAGVPHATGEYLAFVDSDDVLAAHAYETLLTALTAGGGDFASGAVHRFTSRGHHRGYPHNEAIAGTDLTAHVSRDHKLLRDRTIWNKLFRRTFWDAQGFEFPPGRLFEDVPVCVPAHAAASSVAVVNDVVYFWRIREGAVRSITQSDNDLRNLVDRFWSVNQVRSALSRAGHHELRRVYEEQAIWDKLSSYLKFLPAATDEFRSTFLELATAYLADVDPGAVERQPARVRRQWELIRDRRVDELLELIDRGFRPAKASAAPALESALQDVHWRAGKLRMSGYAYVPGAVPRAWTSLRMLWLSPDGGGRKIPLRTKPQRGAAGGFQVTVDPSALRTGGQWRNGRWTVAVAATSGVKVRRDGLRVPAELGSLTMRHRVAPGVWVTPGITKRGRLRLQVVKATGWLASSTVADGVLTVHGQLRAAASGPVAIELSRAKGVVARSYPATVDGRDFTATVPLADVALTSTSDNHATGLYAQQFSIDLVLNGRTTHLAVDDDYVQSLAVSGADQVYTATSPAGLALLCTRPAGPVVTAVSAGPGGELVLAGDTPHPIDGELLLRLRGHRRDVSFPLATSSGRWTVTVDPSAVPGLAGRLPLIDGVWDFAFRSPGERHETTAPLPFTEAALAGLGSGAAGPVAWLRRATGERAVLVVPSEVPAGHKSLRDREWGALRDAVLFDGRTFQEEPAAILAELVSRPDGPEALWTAAQGHPVPPGARRVALHTEAWYEALATSRWLVVNHDLPRWFTPRPGQIVLRLGGGWPVARFGARAQAHPLGADLTAQITADARTWTALTSPDPSATAVLRDELRFDGEVLEFGRPAPAGAGEVRERLGLPADARIVLYAPTSRPMDLRKRGWSDPGRLLDLPQVAAALAPGQVLLVRRHPSLADDVMGLAPGVLDVSTYPSATELLHAADVLITDYSSLLVDAAGAGRPVLLYVPDLDDFRASPGLNVDLDDDAPGPLLRTSGEVVAALRDLEAVAAEHAGAAKRFAAAYAGSTDGRAAARVVDWLAAAGR